MNFAVSGQGNRNRITWVQTGKAADTLIRLRFGEWQIAYHEDLIAGLNQILICLTPIWFEIARAVDDDSPIPVDDETGIHIAKGMEEIVEEADKESNGCNCNQATAYVSKPPIQLVGHDMIAHTYQDWHQMAELYDSSMRVLGKVDFDLGNVYM